MNDPDSDLPGESKEKLDKSNINSDSKDNLIKETNSKTPGIRNNLVNTAVTFLSDINIQNQDPDTLWKFLRKKGLTDAEVAQAFQRLATTKNVHLLPANHRQNHGVSLHAPPNPSIPLTPPSLFPPPVPSMWHTVHNIITTITSIGGILYALYWFWKKYISPYLFGPKPKKKPVEASLAELEAALGGCVADVKTIRSSLEVLAEQKAADFTQGIVVTRIQEVKSEINSLKTLLLSRNQFPATPAPISSGPISIPTWQLNAEGPTLPEHEGEAEEEGTGSNGTTNGSDSSLEIVKDPNN